MRLQKRFPGSLEVILILGVYGQQRFSLLYPVAHFSQDLNAHPVIDGFPLLFPTGSQEDSRFTHTPGMNLLDKS
jgi:hypothetical protein